MKLFIAAVIAAAGQRTLLCKWSPCTGIEETPFQKTLSFCTQADIDRYSGCTSIDFISVRCDGVLGQSDLTNLDAFSSLTAITGKDPTQSQTGGEIGTSLGLTSCPSLAGSALTPLKNVRGRLVGSVSIWGNSRLETVDGLQGIEGVGHSQAYSTSLTIHDNAALTSVAGLEGLKGNMSGSLVVERNPRLANLHGLQGVECWGDCDQGWSGVAINADGTQLGQKCYDSWPCVTGAGNAKVEWYGVGRDRAQRLRGSTTTGNTGQGHIVYGIVIGLIGLVAIMGFSGCILFLSAMWRQRQRQRKEAEAVTAGRSTQPTHEPKFRFVQCL